MLKKIFTGILFAALTASALCISSSAMDVIIDGEKVQFNDSYGYPFISGEGRTLVPLRATMEAFGANVSWDAENRVAIVNLNETTVICPIDQNCIYRNGTKIQNEVGAKIVDGRTYLPIRAVLESFDAVVDFDGNVIVTKSEAKKFIRSIENANPGDKNFWNAWASAMSLFNSGKYEEASRAFIKLAPTVIKYDKPVNVAMLYNHLGFCYEHLGNGEYAAACFERESELWEIVGDHQSAIAASRKAKYTNTLVQLFATTDNGNYNVRQFTDNKFVPKSGLITGVTLKGSSYGYLESFFNKTGKQLSGGLLYARPSSGIYEYMSVLEDAAANDKVIQIGLQPYDLNEIRGITENDGRYVSIAQDIASTGAKVFIRFACEMNDTTSPIFTEDYELYKQKFRIVADIFHKYAPNCAMVWSPNFYPEDTMELYYPGDAYVDFVGISVYAEHAPETDPLEMGVDRSRSATLLNKIVSLYGYKKPMIVSECGASYKDTKTGQNITEFASRQINEFFTYLPIKFPQISSAYLFETVDAAGLREFDFDKNPTYKNAAVSALMSDAYLTSGNAVRNSYSFELGNNVRVPASVIQLHSFIATLTNDFSFVVYQINGNDVGTAYGIPYTVNVDLSAYKGQTVKLTCYAFDSQQNICASRSINLVVEEAVYPEITDQPEYDVPVADVPVADVPGYTENWNENDNVTDINGNGGYNSSVSGSVSESTGGSTGIFAGECLAWNGNEYQVFENASASWEEARAYCEILGGHLVTISSKEENDFVASLLKNGHYFIGGKKTMGSWGWTNGEAMSYFNWSPGEPNDLEGGYEGITGQPYILMYGPTSDFAVGTWDDCWGQNGHAAGFICEWD